MNKRKYYAYCGQRRKKMMLACMTVILAAMPQKKRRRCWVKEWVERHKQQGVYHNLFMELQVEDPDRYRRCLRMDSSTFEYLLDKISPLIQRKNTHLRECIASCKRLAVFLRHIATGETQESLSLTFRLGQSTISGIIKDTAKALLSVLPKEYLKFPSTENEWRNVAFDYGERWNFFNCLGAMDGKHVLIDPPIKSGSSYYNSKGTYSIVLLAVVDAQPRFIFVDVGTNGRVSDSGIWNQSDLKKAVEQNTINAPSPAPLPGVQENFPFVIVGDEGFFMSEKFLIPFPAAQLANRNDRRIFNYRLSRARRCSENVFGILGARFQIFRSAMRYDPPEATNIVLTCCCLHNLLISQVVGRAMYTPPDFIDMEDEASGFIKRGNWRNEAAQGMANIGNQGGNRHADQAIALRNRWTAYFNGAGAVPWQDRMI